MFRKQKFLVLPGTKYIQWINKSITKQNKLSNLDYKVCSKGIKTENVFTKTEMKTEWNIFYKSMNFYFFKLSEKFVEKQKVQSLFL